MIEEVEARNFMSYNHFKIQLVEGLNLLVGEKGSGKTAILEAIRLAFGGLGRERQEVLADFIKKGANHSSIRVKLTNSISVSGQTRRLLPSLPDDSSIVIERELHRDRASVYKINGDRTRKYKLMDILARIGVTPENKLFFLPQEKVNEWVNLGREKRLEMYLRALGLLELKKEIDGLREEIREKKKERKEYLEELDKWERRAEEKKEKVLPPEVAKETLEKYHTFKMAKLIHEKQEIETKIERKRRAEDTMKEKVEKLKQEVVELKEEREEVEKRREEVSEKWQNLMMDKKPKFSDKKNRLERTIKEKQAQLEQLNTKYKEKFSEIRELREKWHIDTANDIDVLIEEKKEEIEEIEEKLLLNSEYKKIQEMENELEVLKSKKKNLKGDLRQHRKRLRSFLKKIGGASPIRKIYLKMLDQDLVQRQGTDSYERVFGPLALEIDPLIPLDEAKDYSFALENGLGGLISSFLVVGSETYEEIWDICRRIKNGHRITTYTIPKSVTTQDLKKIIKRGKSKRKELKATGKEKLGMYEGSIAAWLPEVIEAPLPVMALIEAFHWDVPIVTDVPVANEIIERLELRKVVTLEGETISRTFMPDGKPSIFSAHTSPSLQAKETSIIEDSLGFTIGRFLKNEDKITEKIDQLQTRIRRKQNTIERERDELPKEVRKLFTKRVEFENEITELKGDKGTLKKLKRQRKREIKTKEETKEDIEEMRSEIEEIADKMEEVNEEIDRLRAKERRLVERKEELKETRESKFRKLESLKSKIEDLPLILNALEREKKSKDEEISTTRKEIYGFMNMLKRFDIYPQDKETDVLVEERILKPMEKIQEMDIGSIKEGLSRLKEYSQDYRQAIQETEEKMEKIERMREKIEEYREKIQEAEAEKKEIEELSRKESEELLQKAKEKTETINQNYQRLLSYLDAQGKIEIQGQSVGNLELSTTIDLHRETPLDISKGGFSSGEKTIAIMSMIIAILLPSPAPLYLWDEFEVFLDGRSLEKVITIIKNALKDYQGLLTTTHREELIRAAEKVFYTEYDEEQRRSQVIPLAGPEMRRVKDVEQFGRKWIRI